MEKANMNFFNFKGMLITLCIMGVTCFALLAPGFTYGQYGMGLISDEEEDATEEGLEYEDSSPEYFIGYADVLEISVWRNTELSKVVIVRPDGMISLPLIGDIMANGKTPNDLRQDIMQQLKEYQEAVTVSVIVNTVNSYKIFLLGEVMRPGEFTLTRGTTLIQAIALAGGLISLLQRTKLS